MHRISKRRLTALLAALVMGLSLAGCSKEPASSATEPPAFEKVDRNAVMMTVNGEDITVSEYLPYLYDSLQGLLRGDGMQFYSSVDDIFSLSLDYDGETYPMDEYVHLLAQERIRSAYVIRSLMKEHHVTLSAEQEAELADTVTSLNAEEAKLLGFTVESYTDMMRNSFYEDHALFSALYGAGGELAVPEDELRAYYDKNFVSFLLLRVELTDSDGEEMSAAEKKKVLSRLNTYASYYRTEGDFEKLVAYEQGDRAIAYEDFKGDTGSVNCRIDEVATVSYDQELMAIVQSMAVDELRVAQYKDQSRVPCAALILRVKPGADGMTDAEYYEACQESLLYYMRFDDFESLLREKMDALETTVNEELQEQLDVREYYVSE